MTVDILGTEYNIYMVNAGKPEFVDKYGYCSQVNRKICVEDLSTDKEWEDEPESILKRKTDEILRHEIIHAFLFESGLHEDSHSAENWALNEEMVDWFAIQFPKILKAFEDVGCI